MSKITEKQSLIKSSKNKEQHCFRCLSTKTYLKPDGYNNWYRDEKGNRICKSCYKKYYVSAESKTKHRQKWNPLRYRFKNKRIIAKDNPRTGVCNICRAVVGFDCKKTDMDHDQYDQADPLAHTMELCPSCHRRLEWERGIYNSILKTGNIS